MDGYLRFVFFTGVTKFTKVSIFSDMNQLSDISMNDEYAGICGITEDEMRSEFKPEIEALAEKRRLTYDDCLANVENTYAGIQLRNYMAEQMAQMRQKYGADYEQPTAVPMISPAFNLPSKYIVHVVGPIVSPYLTQKHKDQLAECYRASLELAAENGCENIAFCCISTGVFMFPQDKAAEIAVKTVKEWLDQHQDSCMQKVIFNVFKDSDLEIYQKLLGTSTPRGFKKILRG